MTYKPKSVNKLDSFVVSHEVILEETLAEENDLLSTYSNQSSPPSKKRKPDVCDDESPASNKCPGRNPFCLPRNMAEESTNFQPLTKALSPVKKPTSTTTTHLSPMKSPTKSLSPLKKPNVKVKRKLATTTLVLSRFFKKPATKTDKETEHADDSNQMEIKEQFLHVKSLYENSVNNVLSLYSDVDSVESIAESNVEQQEKICNSNAKTSSDGSAISENIIEVTSDFDENEIAVKKTLNNCIHQTEVSQPPFL